MECARELRDDVRQAVAALHVRELVQQHDAQPLERPAVRVFRHQHRRREDPRRHRHRGASALEKSQPARDPEPGRELDRQRQPRRVDDAHRPPRHPRDRGEPDRQASDDRDDSGRPDCEQDHRQRESRRDRPSREPPPRLAAPRLRPRAPVRGRRPDLPRAAAERWCGSRSVVDDRRRWGRRGQRHERQLPARERDREHRKEERARQRQRPHQVPDRGRRPGEEERDEAREAQDQRGLEQAVDGRQPRPVELAQESSHFCG